MTKAEKKSKKDIIVPKKSVPAKKLSDKKSREKSTDKKSKKSKGNLFERFKKYWFCKAGLLRFGKIVAACILIGIIVLGALFLYYKKSIQDIQLSDIAISETVNTYLDRNGVVLWEDTGNEDYRLVVDGSEISTYMRQATVAIEDKNFYSHPGVDIKALFRAVITTLSGKGVQGGSTLTQQLIKQVYFSDEAASANRGGIARKIKELILALELEKMYDKEQIITMYLNESPYGGRRNGVESAARTYFGKTAAELNLAESALLAAIPNNPAVLNPYNPYGNEMLIARQHKVLDSMVDMGYITEEDANAAKEVAIIDQIQPESSQYAGMLAPHFVLEVRSQLEEKYGISTMRQGGYTITTTLDYRAQQLAESAMAAGSELMYLNKSDNLAMVSLDVETSQVIAMVGSVDFFKEGYGEVNVTTSLMEPGSTIKPVLDYASLFNKKDGVAYGPGSVLRDENINSIYCAGYVGKCAVQNSSGIFHGDVTIRSALGNSLNIPAIKALYITGIDNGLEVLHGLGDKSYCSFGETAGLSMAIGSGCRVTAVEHANAYASLSRGGAYKDIAYVLEVKDSKGNVIESWQDTQAEQIIDPQAAYMVLDMMGDPGARDLEFASQAYAFGFYIPGVWTGSKTGTTTTANASESKDVWFVSISTAVSTVVWNGNHDGSKLGVAYSNAVRRVAHNYMDQVHNTVYAEDGRWSSGDKPIKPSGIKTLSVNGRKADVWPSWYNEKNSGYTKETLVFNKFTHVLASACTPEAHKISVEATKYTDPVTKKDSWNVPEPYNRESEDACPYRYEYEEPSVSIHVNDTTATITITSGSESLKSYSIKIDGEVVKSGSISSSTSVEYELAGTERAISAEAIDVYGGSGSASRTLSW